MRSESVFLREQEQQELKTAIEASERLTSAEIVVVVEPESYSYPQAAFFGSLLISFLLSVAANLALHFTLLWEGAQLKHLWFFPALFAVSFPALFYLLWNVKSLKHVFISGTDMSEEVKEAAMTAFYTLSIGRTEEHNGLLIYISVFEQQVHILTGHGIQEKFTEQTWKPVIGNLTARIRRHEQKEGLIEAVTAVATLLAKVYPPGTVNRNELNDLFIDNGEQD